MRRWVTELKDMFLSQMPKENSYLLLTPLCGEIVLSVEG